MASYRDIALHLVEGLRSTSPIVFDQAYALAKWRQSKGFLTKRELLTVTSQLKTLGWEGEHSFLAESDEPLPRAIFELCYRCRLCEGRFGIPRDEASEDDVRKVIARAMHARALLIHQDLERSECFGIVDPVGIKRLVLPG